MMKRNLSEKNILITAGSAYVDIDAYACMVAMSELLNLKGENAIAYSTAPLNYSVCRFLCEPRQVERELPVEYPIDVAHYIIVDVSDPEFLKSSILIENVIEVYDHHVGFEEYWTSRIGKGANIEFIGAAATLIYREWKKAGLEKKMSRSTTLLMVAAILDNTLNLTSSNTTEEDINAFKELCAKENISKEWCATYFSEVQDSIEADLKNALFGDVKHIRENSVLPPYMGQIAVWNVKSILGRVQEIREWFNSLYDSWMLNIIDIQHNKNYFVCDSIDHQKKIEKTFEVQFDAGIAKTPVSYLRKEIIKKTVFSI